MLEGNTALVLAPHPDDEALGRSGTLVLINRRGTASTIVYLTDGEKLHLWFVSVAIGGWAGSTLNHSVSGDGGRTWTPPIRLQTSPFLNISTLVRNGLVPYADGTLAFPVYHEFISKFAELLRLDAYGQVLDKQRLTPGGSATAWRW